MNSTNSQEISSQKKQTQTVSVNKKAEKNIRNIITLPYEKFWPEVDSTKHSDFVELLRRRLQSLKTNKETLPISALRGKSDAEKKQLKLSLRQKKQDTPQYKESIKLRSHLLLGVNCVCRGLEKSTVCCVLVGGDVDPRLTVQHLVQLAALRRVPVLVLSNLKSVCTQALGFSCTALAFKSEVSSDKTNEFHEIYMETLKLTLEFPVPSSLTLPEAHSSVCNEETSPHKPPVCDQAKPPTSGEIIKKYHLKRPSSGGRAFVPLTSDPIKSKEDFIALGTCEAMEVVDPEIKPLREMKKKTSNFQPLTVKRVKPNPDKVRKNKKKKNKNKDSVK